MMSSQTPVVSLANATKRFLTSAGTAHTAVQDISLDIAPGEFVAVVGPTGCGKSTTLSLVSGLERPSAGTVTVGGKPVTGIPEGVGYMFQADAMLPWRTVLANVSSGPVWRGVAKAEAESRARDWIDRVGLSGFEDYYMHQLSGGMRKRVAIAATLAYQPRIILMDEPFSALDVQTRTLMEDDLLKLWATYRPAVLFITHDLEEAVGLSDRVVVMSASPGRVIGDYAVPLDRPRNLLEIRFDPTFTDTHERI
jgi:NitT/TauT family transport system ATP-binding protein